MRDFDCLLVSQRTRIHAVMLDEVLLCDPRCQLTVRSILCRLGQCVVDLWRTNTPSATAAAGSITTPATASSPAADTFAGAVIQEVTLREDVLLHRGDCTRDGDSIEHTTPLWPTAKLWHGEESGEIFVLKAVLQLSVVIVRKVIMDVLDPQSTHNLPVCFGVPRVSSLLEPLFDDTERLHLTIESRSSLRR